MRFGILNDLHLGHHGAGRWHNRLMYDQAEVIARSALTVLNQHVLEAVFVLGDITEAGQPGQLALARDVLSQLKTPWYILPGNHDRAAVRSGEFDQVFGDHVIQPYMRRDDIGFVGVREYIPVEDRDRTGYQIDQAWMNQSMTAAVADCPIHLVLLSHFPLADESLWAAHHGGKDARCFVHGETWLGELARLRATSHPGCEPSAYKLIALCGHQHWHHIDQRPGWIHCATGAMIEYPMEMRILSIDGDTLHISTLSASVDTIAAASVDSATWVRGRPQDRDGSFTLNTRIP